MIKPKLSGCGARKKEKTMGLGILIGTLAIVGLTTILSTIAYVAYQVLEAMTTLVLGTLLALGTLVGCMSFAFVIGILVSL